LVPVDAQFAVDNYVVAQLAVFVVWRVIANSHAYIIKVVPEYPDVMARPSAADQERPNVVADVVFDEVVVYIRTLGTIGMHGISAVVSTAHYAVGDYFDAFVILGVDTVPMTAVGAEPAVIIDYTPVYLRIDFAFPAAYALVAIMDKQVYIFAVFSAVHVKPARGAIQVTGIRAGTDRLFRDRFRNEYLQVTNPYVCGRTLYRKPPIYFGSLAWQCPNMNRVLCGANEANFEKFCGAAFIGSFKQEYRIPGGNLLSAVQSRGNVPGAGLPHLNSQYFL